ncbi:HNH endonuclease [Brevibacterium rongguiense]|nr:HNH endonuclease [Brevibacterium rongguiense]
MRTDDGQIPLSREEIGDFSFRGARLPLVDRMRGIWRPAGWAATLSVLTKYTPPDKKPPYNDEVGEDGLIRYAWMGEDGNHANNVGLRNAMETRSPVIWFVGVSAQPVPRYNVVCPVYVVGEEWHNKRFILMPVTMDDAPPVEIGSAMEHGFRELEKRYIRRSVKQRLHQPRFRSEVLLAYENHCAICNLAHSPLLDAAHIVPDRDEAGVAQVSNGMAMCKIHHAAFDGYFLGIRPGRAGSNELRVEIRQDLLAEVDGPMLRHGLQELHGRDLMKIPRQRAARPDRALLERAYESFRAASVDDADPGILGTATSRD